MIGNIENNVKDKSSSEQNTELIQQQHQYEPHHSIDPSMAQLLIMRSEMYIVFHYPHLVTINQKFFEEALNIIPDNAAVFLIKSCTEEDTHKAIKYNVWSSTNYGNNKLNKEFETRPVYLLFSTYKSNQFTGLAQMKSEVNFKNTFPLWARDNWRGTFDIKWLLIKDVPFKEFRNVTCEKREKKENGEYNFINYSTKSLSNSPDCQMIPTNEGKEIIKIMGDYQNKNAILEHFEYYDIRQKNFESVVSKESQHNSNYNNYNNYTTKDYSNKGGYHNKYNNSKSNNYSNYNNTSSKNYENKNYYYNKKNYDSNNKYYYNNHKTNNNYNNYNKIYENITKNINKDINKTEN